MTNDMRTVIIPKSDQLNADDLIAGPITITISRVALRPGTEQPVSVHYDGDNGKPYKPCKSMARVMVSCWGADANEYVGRSMTLYNDPKVLWAGVAVGGIRISHMSHIDSTANLMLTATKGSRKPFVVQPLASGAQQQRQQAPGPNVETLLADARDAAGRGGKALDDFLLGLGKDAKAALKPHGEALRAAAVQADATRNDAQGAPGASTAGQSEPAPSDEDAIYRMMTPVGEHTFENEHAYLTHYRSIVAPLFTDGNARELLAFDQANKPLIARVVGLAEAVAAVNAEIRKPAGGLNV